MVLLGGVAQGLLPSLCNLLPGEGLTPTSQRKADPCHPSSSIFGCGQGFLSYPWHVCVGVCVGFGCQGGDRRCPGVQTGSRAFPDLAPAGRGGRGSLSLSSLVLPCPLFFLYKCGQSTTSPRHHLYWMLVMQEGSCLEIPPSGYPQAQAMVLRRRHASGRAITQGRGA